MPDVQIEPEAWRPPSAPDLEGPYAPNELLETVERWPVPGIGPEDVVPGEQGALYCGLEDGSLVRLEPGGGDRTVVARLPGRPLGIERDPRGGLLVCSSPAGLLHVDPDGGEVTTLLAEVDGQPMRFANNAAVTAAGDRVYLTDSSRRFAFADHMADLFEHSGTGRLLVHDRDAGTTEVLLDDLYFANGVALADDESFLLVAESQRYRLTRLWLTGEQAGHWGSFAANLPGIPDNLTRGHDPTSGDELFWVALVNPRDAVLDRILPYPGLRRLLWALPEALHPPPRRYGFVLGLDAGARVVHNLQGPSGEAYARITSARQHDGHLYLGSLDEDAVGRVPVPGSSPGPGDPRG